MVQQIDTISWGREVLIGQGMTRFVKTHKYKNIMDQTP